MVDKGTIKAILDIAFKHEVQTWKDAPGTDAERLGQIVRICRNALDEDDAPDQGVKTDGLDIDTLAGIIAAQREIDNQLPVISGRHGLLQELQTTLGELSLKENEGPALALMNALLCLQAHCRSLGMVKVGR